MTYTVKKIAKLSGVSVRTLHWYDKIGLLKPAFIGQNGYRYYEDEQLFTLLYDILFFKDLGLTLSEIKELMAQPYDKKSHALSKRKNDLIMDIQLKSSLLVSLDKTLHHFETMSVMDGDFPHDFDIVRQREYEFFLIAHKNYSLKDIVRIQQYRIQNFSKTESNYIKNSSHRHYVFMKNMLSLGIKETDHRVINSVVSHFLMLEKFYNLDFDSYCQLPKFFLKRPQLLNMHNFYHSRLTHFISKAIDEVKNNHKELV